MRRSLLNKQILPKPLRQALVLITLLLLPSAAWGQDPVITVAGNTPDATTGNITGDGITLADGGTVTYSNGTLTLTGAEITGDIVWNPSENTDLTINLSGNNTLNGTISTDENTNLSFTGSGSLAIAKESGYAITEFNTVSLATGLYLKSDWPGAYWDEDRNTFVGYNSALSSLTITSDVYYPIWVISSDGVSYTQVSGTNKGNVFNDDTPKVSYDSANNQLTLNNWECATTGGEFAIILGDQKSFNIQLGGVNKIGGSVIFFAKEDASLALSTDDKLKGSLTIVQNQSNNYYFTNIPDVNITYSKLTRTDNAVTYQAPPITVAGVSPDSEGKFSGISGVTFTPATIGVDQSSSTPATLTLDGATITSIYGIVWTGEGNLTIQFSGNNIINSHFGGEATGNVGICITGNSTSTLTITAANDASTLTLKPNYEPSGNDNNKNAIRGFTSVSLNEGWGMYYTDNCSTVTDATSPTAGKEVIICKGQPLGLSVGGVPVTSANINDVLNDGGTVKFKLATLSPDGGQTPDTPATLTLDGATISGNIESSITPLTVYLIGNNTIVGEGVTPFQYTGTNTGELTFNSSNEDEGELVMNGISNVDNISSGFIVGNDFTFYGENGSRWIKGVIGSTVTIYFNVYYGITIEGTSVAKVNKNAVLGLSGSDVSYKPDGNILHIPNNPSVSGYEIKSHRAELNVQITGECAVKAINFDGSKTDEFGTHETKVLNIDRSSTSTPGKNTLTIDTGSDDPAISGFTTVNISENLHFEYPENAAAASVQSYPKVVLSDVVVYDLWVEGQQVTSRNKDDVKGENANPNIPPVTPSVVFNPDNSTLNLTNANIIVTTGNESLSGVVSGVVSGLENLTVKFEGSNSIGKSGDGTFYGFSALDGKTCNIAFTATAGGSCYIEADTENAIHGFNKVTYNDGLAAYINDGFNIAPVTLGKPEFIGVFDDETGKLLSVKVKCIASIPDDQLDTPDPVDILSYDLIYTLDGGEETAYTGPITISGPCTLTAKTIVGNTSSDVATGKYFGAKKDAFTMAIGESLADLDWCTPTFNAETEYIICKFISESNVFNYDVDNSSEAISAKATGTGTVNVELSYNDAMVTQILNGEKPITFTINVGEGLSSVFEGSNDYGGLYNDSDTPYALPEGTTAYLITGISEDGTSVATQDIGYLPARTVVLLQRGEGAKAITKIPYEGSATVPTNNKFYYSDPNSPATAPTTRSWYVIYNNKFVKVTGGTQVKGGKCYLDLGTTAGTRGFYNIGDGEGTTAIHKVISEGVNSEKLADGEWYTLQGQRVAKPAKGLYILNGKKVVVK